MVKRRRQRRRLRSSPDRVCVLSPHTQLPLKDEALAFGVGGDTLTVAAELGRWCGSWRRARVPWRDSSMRRPPPKTPYTSLWRDRPIELSTVE